MFPVRYFPTYYFTASYFPKEGTGPVTYQFITGNIQRNVPITANVQRNVALTSDAGAGA